MKIAYALHCGIAKVLKETGKRPCEIILHPTNYSKLLTELGGYWRECAQAQSPLPKFEGIPIIVDVWCEKEFVYLPTTPIFTKQ